MYIVDLLCLYIVLVYVIYCYVSTGFFHKNKIIHLNIFELSYKSTEDCLQWALLIVC